MTFLNGLLALGALAFTVPLAIHLLFRSRFRTVDWGAMHLLADVARINRRRLQLMNLLLLLLRCLLPILLAFCLARPILTGFRSLPGDAPQSLVIAIDDSRSMAARDESGVGRLDRAKQELSSMIQGLSRRDEVILIRSSAIDAPPATMGVDDTVAKLREVRAQSGKVNFGRFLRAAVDASDEGSHQQRRVIVVSDFQSADMGESAIESINRLSSSMADKTIRPVISFWNLGVDSEQLENVSVDSVEISSPAVVAGRVARFSARIRNASDTPMRDLRIVWSVDGKETEPRTLSIDPRSSSTSRLTRRIEKAGVHEITLAVEHGDALTQDNRRSIGVDVIHQVDVMLVDGQPGSGPLSNETDFLAIALSPFAFGGEDQPDAVRTSVVRPNQVLKEIDEKQPDVLVLANVEALRDDVRSRIASFVSSGGALLVFDGDNLDGQQYNRSFAGDRGSWELPAKLGEFVGSPWSKEAKPLAIGFVNTQYTPWNVLGTDAQAFHDVQVYGYRRLSLNESDASEESPMTLLSMASGDPLALTARRGRGRVVQFAVPCDGAWTTLPMRMVYLPMMQQLVLDLAGSQKQTTALVGTTLSVATSELSDLIEDKGSVDADKSATYTVQRPGEGEEKIEVRDDGLDQLLVTQTNSPGLYRIRQTTPVGNGDSIVTNTIRVIETPASESKLRDVLPSRLTSAAESLDANVYADLVTLQSDDRTRRFGREIWRWLLVLLLIAMIAELYVQQRSLGNSSIAGAP